MTLDYKIFFEPRDAEEKILAATSTEEVVATLLQLFDLLIPTSYVDPEMLQFDGIYVSRAGHRRVDVALAAWLGPSPGARRLELVGWFAFGYWGLESRVESEPLLTDLLASVSGLQIGSQPYVGVLYALANAYATRSLPAPLEAAVKAALLDERARLAEAGLAEGLRAYLAELP